MPAQILAIIIFLAMFVLIVADKIERHIVTISAGALTVVFVFLIGMRSTDAVWETLNFGSIFTSSFWLGNGAEGISANGINWETIIFVFGMMVMVEGMAEAGFFRWLCLLIAKLVSYKPLPIFVSFMILSAILSMFIDSITVILFLAAVTVELGRMLKFDPVPYILAEIFCANLGGSATMCGDPPNIIIGTSLGYSFTDFIVNTGIIAAISLVITVVYFCIVMGRSIKAAIPADTGCKELEPKSAVTDKAAFAWSCAIFAAAIVLLVTHAKTGLSVASIGVIIACVTLIAGYKSSAKIMKRVDYKTLLFFIGLFVTVGGLEQTGVLELIAGFIGKICGGRMTLMIAVILWLSAVASALIDNIPFAATMLPVIRSLAAATGADLGVLAWSLAIGTDIGGSATPIGASANVVGISTLNREGHRVSWGKYCRLMVPATLIVIAVSMAYLYIRYL